MVAIRSVFQNFNQKKNDPCLHFKSCARNSIFLLTLYLLKLNYQLAHCFRHCQFIYLLQPDTYVCPQCQAPKKRFARYDVNTGKAIGGGLPPIGVIVGLVAGIGAVGALLVYGLQ